MFREDYWTTALSLNNTFRVTNLLGTLVLCGILSVPSGLQRKGTRLSLATRESGFNLSSDDNHVRAWRPRGERLNPAFALQRHTTPTAAGME
ncbi:hypothetical protein TNCV_1157741 [Trichonephila clavipes]|nr:hypothetical protein TNCV_1157741 [Trichonephila clavipes]